MRADPSATCGCSEKDTIMNTDKPQAIAGRRRRRHRLPNALTATALAVAVGIGLTLTGGCDDIEPEPGDEGEAAVHLTEGPPSPDAGAPETEPAEALHEKWHMHRVFTPPSTPKPFKCM